MSTSSALTQYLIVLAPALYVAWAVNVNVALVIVVPWATVTFVKPKPAEYSSLELWEPGETMETLKSDAPLVIVAPDVTLVPESLLIDPA